MQKLLVDAFFAHIGFLLQPLVLKNTTGSTPPPTAEEADPGRSASGAEPGAAAEHRGRAGGRQRLGWDVAAFGYGGGCQNQWDPMLG